MAGAEETSAGEGTPSWGEAIDRRWNTAGEMVADPPFEQTEGVSSGEEFKQDPQVKEGEDIMRGKNCEESPPITSRKLANVLGESSVTGANIGFERTSTTSAKSVTLDRESWKFNCGRMNKKQGTTSFERALEKRFKMG